MFQTLIDPAFLAAENGGTPVLDLNFAALKSLDSRITFARASTGTFINSSGLVETASAGVARFTHDPSTLESRGLLVEESRENLALRSEQFDVTWITGRVTVSADSITAPDVNTSADKINEITVTGTHEVNQTVTRALGTYTFSVFVKAAERSRVRLDMTDLTTGDVFSDFNLTTGQVVQSSAGGSWTSVSSTITAFTNGWYRLTLTSTRGAGVSQNVKVQIQDNSGNTSYTGTSGSGLYVWGAQLEAGAFATSYIPTGGASATRAADLVQMTGTNFSSWYNSAEGTFAVAYRPQQLGIYQQILQVDDGTLSNQAPSLSQHSANTGRLDWWSGGSNQISTFTAGTISLEPTLVATSYKIGVGGSIAANGAVNTSSTAITTPTSDRLIIGNRSAIDAYLNAPIARIRYYNRRVPDSSLQAIST